MVADGKGFRWFCKGKNKNKPLSMGDEGLSMVEKVVSL